MKDEEQQQRIYHLKGNPFEVGYAMGRRLGPRLAYNIERYVRARILSDVPVDENRWRSGALPWLRSLPARFQEEFEGLAQGAELPLQRIAEWVYLEVLLSDGCSATIVTLDGRAWVARNNDMFVPEMWGYVTIREVTGRIPTISFGLEGDVFTSTGINRERLWLHTHYAPAWDAPVLDEPHLPSYAFLVEALETCRTLEDVEALLERIQRDDGMLLFAVDGKTDAYALYECTCTDFRKREASEGWLVGTNHYCVHPHAPSPGRSEPLNTVARHERLEALVEDLIARENHPSPARELIQLLADDEVEAREGDLVTVYSNVTCPGTGEMWHTFGGVPAASRGKWRRLEWPW